MGHGQAAAVVRYYWYLHANKKGFILVTIRCIYLIIITIAERKKVKPALMTILEKLSFPRSVRPYSNHIYRYVYNTVLTPILIVRADTFAECYIGAHTV